ncbi:hypothetical protein CERSUDRAFT_147159 [Gelatoporia subvermispora B]|uniref:Elongator complex protein 5 n=1 Tax=Ceriporiopsis subvermispora (strain B) TaxID=914234 RepID=M2RSB4_CERS8|nr:hypothetical protein CERSUDRAFT_147159 [Gelatoporia subvermispora B]
MPSLLPSILSNSASRAQQQPFLLLQSSLAQSCLPLIRELLRSTRNGAPRSVLLFCLLHPPSALADVHDLQSEHVQIFDWTNRVPVYTDDYQDPGKEVLSHVRTASAGPVTVIIDSLETLLSDVGSLAKTQQFLWELISAVRTRSGARLIIHVLAPSPALAILSETKFSPSLAHITAHPPALLSHIASAYLTPPPPSSPPEKFWRVFIPIAERHYESEKLVYGSNGDGSGSKDMVLEILVRGGDGSGRRRAVERVLEGWSSTTGPCELSSLESLKALFTKKAVQESGSDPTQNLSFNLNLTPEQQQSRAQVPLPYAHEGTLAEQSNEVKGAILYDPDSADDIDDDDPDEDLDI